MNGNWAVKNLLKILYGPSRIPVVGLTGRAAELPRQARRFETTRRRRIADV